MKLPKLTAKQSQLLAIVVCIIISIVSTLTAESAMLEALNFSKVQYGLLMLMGFIGLYYVVFLILFLIGRGAVLLVGGELDSGRAYQASLNVFVVLLLLIVFASAPIKLDLFL